MNLLLFHDRVHSSALHKDNLSLSLLKGAAKLDKTISFLRLSDMACYFFAS